MSSTSLALHKMSHTEECEIRKVLTSLSRTLPGKAIPDADQNFHLLLSRQP
jgi:hypothetical protein